MAIDPDATAEASDFIYENEKDGTPANDEGRVPKLEIDAKLSEEFLRYATKFTAGEDLAADTPVGIGLGGELARAVRAAATDGNNMPSDLDGAGIIRVISVDTNRFILMYGYNDDLFVVAFTTDPDTYDITFGSASQVTGTSENTVGSGICKLDTNKFIAAYSNDGSNDCQYKIYTVSGTTLTEQSSGNLQNASVTHGALCQLATDKFAFFYCASDTANTYIGFATVATYTPTVVDAETNSINNIGETGYQDMIKLATDKFLIFTPETGYGVVCTTVSPNLVVGTAQSLQSFGARLCGRVISLADNTFWARSENDLGYYTVSGTVITMVDSLTLADDVMAELITDGTDIYELHVNTDPTKDGLYLIELDGSTIVRTHLKNFTLADANVLGIRGAYDGARYAAIGGVTSGQPPRFHVQGMTENYIGFTEEAADKDDVIRVVWKGIIGGQSGIIPGRVYEIADGGLDPNSDPNAKYTVIGKDSTHVFT